MAFQDRAESLAARLHLSRVPRPVFAGIALALALMVALAVFALAGTSDGPFEVTASAADAGGDTTTEVVEGDGGSNELEVQGEGDQGPASSSASAEDVALPASETEERRLCVHVDGCVEAPGVYYLPVGSRVIDGVTAAGGTTADARTEVINLAQELQDGQQIVVPSRSDDTAASAGADASSGEARETGAAAPSDGLVNINTATAQELQTLKGIGEATAEKIIADREANGPFKSIDDLTRVSGIGEKKLSAIRDGLCL